MIINVDDPIALAIHQVILKGRPTGQEAEIVVLANVHLENWPMAMRLGPHRLYLTSIENLDGEQQAIYERRAHGIRHPTTGADHGRPAAR